MRPITITQTANPPQRAVGGALRVVVADDSAAMRTLVRHSLTPRRGFAIVGEATNGFEALTLAESQRPDCVVLDVQMPAMGGLEALQKLQQRFPSVPVVMLCGALSEDLSTAVRHAGAAAALNKAHDLSQLPETVRRVTSYRPADTEQESIEAEPPAVAAPRPPRDSPATPSSERPADTSIEELRRLEYAVSHDLGEPLRIMAGFSRLLRERNGEALDDSGRLFLGQISDAADRMQSMFDDLLAYSRAGQATAHLAAVDVTQQARDLCVEVSAHATPRRITCSVAELPSVVADQEMLRTTLRHVIANALVFNRSDVPSVRIAGRLEGRTAVITIEDNGIGVATKDAERVFGLFQRLNTREEYPGNGMGLSLCRRLLARQGGSIQLSSEPGTGTRVTLKLPTQSHHEGGAP